MSVQVFISRCRIRESPLFKGFSSDFIVFFLLMLLHCLFLQYFLKADLLQVVWFGLGKINLAQEYHVLSPYHEHATRDVSEAFAHVDPLDGLVKDKVSELIHRSQVTWGQRSLQECPSKMCPGAYSTQ